MLDLQKASAQQLKDVLELFVKAGVVVPTEELTNNVKRIAFIEAAIAEKGGFPHEVTQEDLERNPDLLEEGVGVGEILFLPVETEEGESDVTESDEEGADSEDAPEVPEKPAAPSEEAPSTSQATSEQRYNNNIVVSVQNRVVNGRVYKEVRTSVETALLSQEDYETMVK
jgi:hypothetical protein